MAGPSNRLSKKIEESKNIINKAIEEYNPSSVFGFFSGGHDSLVSSHIIAQHPRFTGLVHINTGIGIPETREFVRNTAKKWGVKLFEYKADEYVRKDGTSDPQKYEDIIKEYGFPGPKQHRNMYIRLKEKPLYMLAREHKKEWQGRNKYFDKLIYVTGVRSSESVRRMGTTQIIKTHGCMVWVAPIISWEKRDINEYIDVFELERNEVVKKLCMSGECLCGAFATKDELELISIFYPDTAEYILSLQKEVEKIRDTKNKWGWGIFNEYEPSKGKKVYKEDEHIMMCQSCEKRLEINRREK